MQETSETRFDSWAGKISWRRKWQPTPVFLPGESHGQRSLVGYGPQGHKESDMIEVTWHAQGKPMSLNAMNMTWFNYQKQFRTCPLTRHPEDSQLDGCQSNEWSFPDDLDQRHQSHL